MQDDLLIIGRFGTVYGVKGWLKVISFTEPTDNIFNYPQWFRQHQKKWLPLEIQAHKKHGNGLIVKLAGIDDREIARNFTNDPIAIHRNTLPALPDHEFYWNELIGLQVVTEDGTLLGNVDDILETSSNDVFVVKGKKEHLVPYLDHVVKNIDLINKIITIDWDPDF